MLGISAYLQDLDVEYLKKAAEIGVRFVFTSLHIPEENLEDSEEKLDLLLKTCQENDLLLVPDISPVTFEKLGIKNRDMTGLKKIGIKALRLDFGFDDYQELVVLQKDFQLFLNASIVDETFLKESVAAGVDLSKVKLSHNFYPKIDTGLAMESFRKDNYLFTESDLKVQAFVPGDALKRFPLYQGLPTLEKHRGTEPYVCAVDLLKNGHITDIAIGDSQAKLSTLKMIHIYMVDNIMTLPAFLIDEQSRWYEQVLEVRKDLPENVVRLATPRVPSIPIGKTLERKQGMITMENKLGARYSGEINLCRKDLPFSETTNSIGFIHPNFVDLLDWIDRDTRIRFVPIEKIQS